MDDLNCPNCGSKKINIQGDDDNDFMVRLKCTECGHTWPGLGKCNGKDYYVEPIYDEKSKNEKNLG